MLFRLKRAPASPRALSVLHRSPRVSILSTIALVLAVSSAGSVHANTVEQSLKVTADSHKAMASNQKKLNKIDDETQGMVSDYLFNQRQADIAEAYNAQLQRLINSQEDELSSLKDQIVSVEKTEQAMLPLLNVMVAKLRQFVAQDLPFLPDERAERLKKLSSLLDRADVSVAEKYRQILEAYLVEVGYGRTIEAYSDVLLGDDTNTRVNYLRVGRMALYHQGLNGQDGALWLPAKQAWLPLASEQNLELSKALQMAQQQRVPELLDLPVPNLTQAQ